MDTESLNIILPVMPALKRLDLQVHTFGTLSGQHKRIGEIIVGCASGEGSMLREARIVECAKMADITRTLDDYAALAGLDHLHIPLGISRYDQDLDNDEAEAETPASATTESGVKNKNIYGTVEVDIFGWKEEHHPFSLASKLAHVFSANARITLNISDSSNQANSWIKHVYISEPSDQAKRWVKHVRSTRISLVKRKAKKAKVGFKLLPAGEAEVVLAGMSTFSPLSSKGVSTDQVGMGIWAEYPTEGIVNVDALADTAVIEDKANAGESPDELGHEATGRTAGNQVFGNSLILHEVLRWVRMQRKKTLASCLALQPSTFTEVAEVLYYASSGDVLPRLIDAGCELVSSKHSVMIPD